MREVGDKTKVKKKESMRIRMMWWFWNMKGMQEEYTIHVREWLQNEWLDGSHLKRKMLPFFFLNHFKLNRRSGWFLFLCRDFTWHCLCCEWCVREFSQLCLCERAVPEKSSQRNLLSHREQDYCQNCIDCRRERDKKQTGHFLVVLLHSIDLLKECLMSRTFMFSFTWRSKSRRNE